MEGHEKVYTICDNMCLEESLTKEQIEDTVDTQVRSYGVPTNGVLRFDGTEAQIPGGYEKVTDLDDLGTIVHFFGDVMGDIQNMGVSCPSTCTAKKINADGIWELNFQGQYSYTSTTANIFVWGYELAKINALISPLIGKTLKFEEGLQYKSQYRYFTPEGALKIEAMQYGSCYELVSGDGREFAEPARYYTTDGSHGGWPVNYFENLGEFEATLYLKEV